MTSSYFLAGYIRSHCTKTISFTSYVLTLLKLVTAFATGWQIRHDPLPLT